MKPVFIGSISTDEALVLVDKRLQDLVSTLSDFKGNLETIQHDESEECLFPKVKSLQDKSEKVRNACHKLSFIVDDLFEAFEKESEENKELNDSLP